MDQAHHVQVRRVGVRQAGLGSGPEGGGSQRGCGQAEGTASHSGSPAGPRRAALPLAAAQPARAPPLCRLACCSAGLGQIDHEHLYKNDPELGMLVVKIGGPAYRIGMGGGAASSVPSGSNSADLDFNAVQVRRLPALGAMCSGGACACRRADAAGTWTGTRAAHSRECLLRMPAAPVRPRSAATPR